MEDVMYFHSGRQGQLDRHLVQELLDREGAQRPRGQFLGPSPKGNVSAGEPHLLADLVVWGRVATAIRQCLVTLGRSQERCSGGPPDPTTASQVVLYRGNCQLSLRAREEGRLVPQRCLEGQESGCR